MPTSRRATVKPYSELYSISADSWDGPHFRFHMCGINTFAGEPSTHAMFMDAVEAQGCWEYVVEGALHYKLGSERIRIEPGEALVTRRPDPGWMLRPVKESPVKTIWITMTGESALRMFDFLHLKFGQIQHFTPDSPVVRGARRLFRLAATQKHRPAHFWSENLFQWLNGWWAYAQAEHRQIERTQLKAIQPSRLISYAPKTVKNFASEMGYSRAYLTRKLTQQWQRSPGQVLREVRMKDAAALLRTTRLSVGEVAQKVGYTTSAGFCRAFHQHHKQSPRVYRMEHT